MTGDPFTIFRGVDGQWYWHLKAANGEIIATSEGYQRRQGAVDGVTSVRNSAAPAAPTKEENQ